MADWSLVEVEALVADYLEMLALEVSGVPFNKAERNRRLQRATGRSEGSVEYKHRNVTAVLIRAGWPYVAGYKPAWNSQRLLEDVVLQRIANDSRLTNRLLTAAQETVLAPATAPDILDAEVQAPPPVEINYATADTSDREPMARVIDFVDIEGRNRSLGRAGEEWVVSFERARLAASGLGAYVNDVEHVSATRGDGLGYDVRSFDQQGRERFIEVKTTAYGVQTPFLISRNELAFARREAERYRLYRVFQFRVVPRLYRVAGPVEGRFRLDPTVFRAFPGRME
jgi:hypothetical protein